MLVLMLHLVSCLRKRLKLLDCVGELVLGFIQAHALAVQFCGVVVFDKLFDLLAELREVMGSLYTPEIVFLSELLSVPIAVRQYLLLCQLMLNACADLRKVCNKWSKVACRLTGRNELVQVFQSRSDLKHACEYFVDASQF